MLHIISDDEKMKRKMKLSFVQIKIFAMHATWIEFKSIGFKLDWIELQFYLI
jgi:hypothetical protein